MQKMKNNIVKFFLTFFILMFITILAYFLNDYLNFEYESKVKAQMDSHLKELSHKIKDKKNIILTAAVLLSKDNDVKECLSQKNRSNCFEHLKSIQKTFSNVSFSIDAKIHVHTKDLKSFFRLWESYESENDALSSFRESLLIVKDSKKELAGVEIGRSSLLLRGISPVLNSDEYLGSIEVISDFNSISKSYRQKGINFYVLMNKSYEDLVKKISYTKEKKVGNFIVVNDINSRLYSLENIDFKGTNYIKKENYYILFTPIFDIIGNEIGYYVLKIQENKIDKFL